jgi:hypothetical protein
MSLISIYEYYFQTPIRDKWVAQRHRAMGSVTGQVQQAGGAVF